MRTLRLFLTGLFVLACCSFQVLSQTSINPGNLKIAIAWQKGPSKGAIEVLNGKLLKIEILTGKGRIKGNSFEIKSNDVVRIVAILSNVQNKPGSGATVVTVRADQNPFSFFLRDVQKEYPIFIPEYHVAVSPFDDLRTYA